MGDEPQGIDVDAAVDAEDEQKRKQDLYLDVDADIDGATEGDALIHFKVMGEWYTAPRDPEAETIIKVVRGELDLTNPESILEAMELFVGEAQLTSILERRDANGHKCGIQRLMRTVTMIAEAYGFKMAEEVVEAEAAGEAGTAPPTETALTSLKSLSTG